MEFLPLYLFGGFIIFMRLLTAEYTWYVFECIFGLSPDKQKALDLIKRALQNKNYILNHNSISYCGDTRVHLLDVFINLGNAEITVSSTAAYPTILIREFGTGKFSHSNELHSLKAVYYIYDHFSNLIYEEERNRREALANRASEVSNKVLRG